MANEKVSFKKGLSSNLSSVNYVTGQLLFTTDDGKLYIDTSSSASGRVAINAAYADLANSASKLTSSAGSSTRPVYFQGGAPVQCTYSLNKDVPSDAVFTDTHYISNFYVTNSANGTSFAATTNPYIVLRENGAQRSQLRLIGSGATSISSDSSGNITINSINTTYSAATTSAAGLMSATDKAKLDGIASGATKIVVDSALSSSSTNPVQNKVIQAALDGKSSISHTHYYAGSSSIGGAATSANKLNTNAGDSNTPVYFSNGVPVACTSLDLNTTGSSASCTGNAATATYVKDSYNGSNISVTYAKSGQSSTSWLASWNGYELGSISPSILSVNYANSSGTASSASKATYIGDSTMNVYAEYNNEVNFGGTSESDVIYFGYRAKDSKNKPTYYNFSRSVGVLQAYQYQAGPWGVSWLAGQQGEGAGINMGSSYNVSGFLPWIRQTDTYYGKYFAIGTLTNCIYFMGSSSSRTENGYDHGMYLNVSNGGLYTEQTYGAVWNDYAEFRSATQKIEPGRVVQEKGDDTLIQVEDRLSHFAGVCSDTFGFAIGQRADEDIPIAVSGRVLVYPYKERNTYKPGDCVCTASNGTVDVMTREEVIQYPDRIVGTVSCVPEYDIWLCGAKESPREIEVDGRIWIKVK